MSRQKQKELARRRRNDKFRRRRAKRTYILWSWGEYGFKSRESFVQWAEERAIKEGDIRKVCSCSMCGNPRRYYGDKTKHEILFEMEYREALKDVAD